MESESSDPLSLQQAKTSDAQPTPAATNGLDDSGQGSQTKTSDAQPPPPTASGEDEVVQSTDVNTEDARHPPPATSGLENSEHSSQHKPLHVQPTPATSGQRSEPILPASGVSSWAKNLKVPQSLGGAQEDSQAGNGAKSTFVRLASGLGLQFSPANQTQGDAVVTSNVSQAGVFDSFKKGLVDSSRSAVKAVQVKARHMVSQNKRRYQDGEFDLDMTYITHNIIAMGFPAGDMSSGLFGYVEGFYRNHMEEVIKFFESHHKGKYKVYNLCSERLYDASLFQGKAASFPFDDHNCPPVNLILSFCQSASTWLKEDIENVVVVHCKAGLGRTGLMISSLLLYLTFCPTAEESMDYFNQKRCVDGKGLILPSQIRYVKYFERILKDYGGQNPNGRRCMLRGFRLHGCPYWIRPSITISDHNGILFSTKKHPKTKDLMPEDFWIKTSKKGVVIFALPGEPGLTELSGDFKIHFHDRHGDFYCWLNTAMMENKTILSSDDLDGYDKRKLPSPRFQLDIVMVDYNGKVEKRPTSVSASNTSDKNSDPDSSANKNNPATTKQTVTPDAHNKDDVFSDSEGEEETKSSTSNQAKASNAAVKTKTEQTSVKEPARMKTETGPTSGLEIPRVGSSGVTDFKAIAADASVFSFGDEDDESD